MPKELACRRCRALTTEKRCPVCGSTDLSENWSGMVIIVDPEKSEVAKIIGAKVRGKYALNVVQLRPSNDLILPERTRKRLKKPLGRLVERPDEEGLRRLVKEPFVTVGDKVTESFCSLGYMPKLEIVDGREMREERLPPEGCYHILIKVKNPPGRITQEALKAVREALKADLRVRILVEGEEDLLALPCILYGPDGMRVFYGQPGEGVVYVDVDESSRALARRILKEMGLKVYK